MAYLHTFADVRFYVSRRLNRPIPPATIRRWKRVLGITAERINGEWLYCHADIDAIVTLGQWLKNPDATISGFCRKYSFTRNDQKHG